MPNNILITPGSASIQFSGSAANTIRLQVEQSGSVAFYGNSGTLFGITDSLSGSLMSVNDISGLPILEVFSDDRVVMGTFNSNALVVTGSQVGIGTTTPGDRLVVKNSGVSGDGIKIQHSNGTEIVDIGGEADGDSYAYLRNGSGTSTVLLYSNGSSYLNGGNVGIATTSPQSTLHVAGTVSYGTIRITPTSANGESCIAFFTDTAGTDTNDAWVVGHAGWGNTGDFVIGNENNGGGGNVRLLIEKGGNVGIGTTTPAQALHVAGQIIATSEITAYYSDARLKNFHGTIPNAGQKVALLNGYYFTENELAKSLGYDNDKIQVGVSAQEVQAVLPEAVAPAPVNSEYLAVRYEKLVPLLIEAIKELQAEVAELKKQR